MTTKSRQHIENLANKMLELLADKGETSSPTVRDHLGLTNEPGCFPRDAMWHAVLRQVKGQVVREKKAHRTPYGTLNYNFYRLA